MRRRSRWIKRQVYEEERIKDSDMFKIVEEVFDSFTMTHLYRLESRGVVWELKGVVSSGKEARIYWGKSRGGEDLAVKIYLSMTSDFRKSIRRYIEGDPRFERIPQGNFRKLIYEWTRKEYRNLRRMKESGVRVPRPIAFSGNILVMEFLGENGYRAPLLSEAAPSMSRGELEEVYRDLLAQVELMVCKAGLVHADLSEYNVMVWRGEPWIIDVAQAVSLDHPLALEFLERDLENIHRFFAEYISADAKGDLKARIKSCLEAA